MNRSAKHIELLDYMRGIAILAVLLDHTVSNVYGFDTLPWKGWFRDFSGSARFLCFLPLSFGAAGVAIFFVVSGFCIHLSFQQQGKKWGVFFVRRFFRIYPAYLAAMIFFILLSLNHARLGFHDQQVWVQNKFELPRPLHLFSMQLFTHLFLVHNFHPLTFSGITGAFWSLAVEAQLYLLYPVLLALVGKLGWRRTMVILAGCELFIRGADGLLQTVGGTNTMGVQIAGFFARTPLGYWFSWALGAFIADAFLNNRPLPFVKTPLMGWLALTMVCYFVKPLYSFWFLLFAVMSAVAAGKFLNRAANGTAVRSVSLTLLGKIGLWSYSIYLLHQPLLNIYTNAIAWAVPAEYRSVPIVFMLIVASWLVVIPFSVLWHGLFELPGIAWGKQIIRKNEFRQATSPGLELSTGNGPVGLPRKRCYFMVAALLVLAGGSFWMSVKLKPFDPVEDNNLAWSLATSPEAANRNGALAVQLAENACEQTHYQVTVMVGTLAAAYAEAGRFEDAVSMAKKAYDLASRTGNQKLLQKNQQLLDLYLKHQPYRERQVDVKK